MCLTKENGLKSHCKVYCSDHHTSYSEEVEFSFLQIFYDFFESIVFTKTYYVLEKRLYFLYYNRRTDFVADQISTNLRGSSCLNFNITLFAFVKVTQLSQYYFSFSFLEKVQKIASHYIFLLADCDTLSVIQNYINQNILL